MQDRFAPAGRCPSGPQWFPRSLDADALEIRQCGAGYRVYPRRDVRVSRREIYGLGSRSSIDRSVWRPTVSPICASSPAAWIVVLMSSAPADAVALVGTRLRRRVAGRRDLAPGRRRGRRPAAVACARGLPRALGRGLRARASSAALVFAARLRGRLRGLGRGCPIGDAWRCAAPAASEVGSSALRDRSHVVRPYAHDGTRFASIDRQSVKQRARSVVVAPEAAR